MMMEARERACKFGRPFFIGRRALAFGCVGDIEDFTTRLTSSSHHSRGGGGPQDQAGREAGRMVNVCRKLEIAFSILVHFYLNNIFIYANSFLFFFSHQSAHFSCIFKMGKTLEKKINICFYQCAINFI